MVSVPRYGAIGPFVYIGETQLGGLHHNANKCIDLNQNVNQFL